MLRRCFSSDSLRGPRLARLCQTPLRWWAKYSPRRLCVAVMMVVGNGFTTGAAFGGFIAAWLIPHFGWRSGF